MDSSDERDSEDDDIPSEPAVRSTLVRGPPEPAVHDMMEQEVEDEQEEPQEEEEVDGEPAVLPLVPAPPGLPGGGAVPMPPNCTILDHHLDQIRDYSVAVPTDILLQAMDEFMARWIGYPKMYEQSLIDCAYKLFGYNNENDIAVPEHVTAKETTFVEKGLFLYFRMQNAGLVIADVEESVIGLNFTRTLETINNLATMIKLHARNKVVTDLNVSLGNTSAVHKWELAISTSDEDATRYQKFLLYLLRTAYDRNLRKYNGRLYKQIVVHPYRTHAWELECDIAEYVYGCAKKEGNFEMWLNMTSSHSNISNAIEYLKSCKDFELPTLVPNRHVFAFKNCLYDAENNTVYEYADSECHIPSAMVAAKFFNIEFPIALADVEQVDWRDIPTIKLDYILDHQKIPTEPHIVNKKEYFVNAEGKRKYRLVPDEDKPLFSAKDWFYIFIGRMVYEIHEHDDWQVLMFIKGVAGSGKSTLGKIVSYLYDANDVGVLSNNTEKKFGLSALVEKLIYVCYEVKNDFALDQGEFQCMVSGEQMSIPFKHEMAQSVMWRTHGMFMGNEVASWCDNSGSMSRRIVLGLFNEIVTDGNPKLFSELQEEMGHILVKCNRAYREAAFFFGHMDVWNVLPHYFVSNRRQLRANTHPLAYFFENTTELLWDKNGYMSLQDLQLMMNIFLSSDGSFKTHKKGFNADFYQWVLDAYELRVETDVRDYKGSVSTLPFVTGLTDKSAPHLITVPALASVASPQPQGGDSVPLIAAD